MLGIYQAPLRNERRDCGVVLCPAMAREYLLAHRSFRQLATRLSEAGFGVLRFDFYGCGDSCGSSEEGSLSQWQLDVSSAVAEMKKRFGARRICLVGLRLGATLAVKSGLDRHDVDSMVLWNPVIQGHLYLEDMRSLHRVIFRHLQGKNNDAAAAEKDIGLLGFRLTDSMETDLETIDLYRIHKKPAEKILVVQSSDSQVGEDFARFLSATGAQADFQFVPFAPVWTEGIYKSHVPVSVLSAMTAWIAKVNA